MSFKDLTGAIVNLVNTAVMPLLYALAFLFFLFGIARLFFSDNEEKRTQGKQFALWGIIALAVMFGVWGVVQLFLSILTANPS